MVDRHESALDDFVGHLVTALAAGLNEPAVAFTALEKMACEADFLVYAEVLLAFDVTVTEAAGDSYAVDHVLDVNLVSEFHAAVNQVFRFKLSGAVALGSQTGDILNRGVGLCTDSADRTGDSLSETVYLAPGVTGKARP
jgi:hypothetical protein